MNDKASNRSGTGLGGGIGIGAALGSESPRQHGMTRPLETAQNQRLSEYEESVTLEEPSDYETAHRHRRTWIVAGGVATLMVAVGLAALILRARNHSSAKTAPGSIDWKLSVFSNNRIVFRPSLALSTGRDPRRLRTGRGDRT